MERAGWTIEDAKSGQSWTLEVSPSVAFPAELGEGGLQLLGMHGGFQFCTLDGHVKRPATMVLDDPSSPEERVELMLVASLQGDVQMKPGGFARGLHVPAGGVCVYPVPEPVMTVNLSPVRQYGFDIGFSRALLQRVAAETRLPPPLQRLAEGRSPRAFALPGRLDQRLERIINELRNNPYTNGAARLYQEAKGLEIIALLIDAWGERACSRRHRWKRRDLDLLQEAKSRLVSNIENPPSLLDLARCVGMSPTKLKRGFREVFGTTVTDTVREARLKLAHTLLETGDLPLKLIALSCGFCDAASLSHAFRRHYGINPGQLRRAPKEFPVAGSDAVSQHKI